MRTLLLLALLLSACQGNYSANELAPEIISRDAIVGGVEVPPTDLMAYKSLSLKVLSQPVVARNEDAVETTFQISQCTAFAVAPRIILTAAHCVSAAAHEYRLEVPNKDGAVTIRKGLKAQIHPAYVTDHDADLALILLDVALPEEVQIMKLPTKNQPLNLTVITAAGFGRMNGKRSLPGGTGKLRHVDLDVIGYSPASPTFRTDQRFGKGVCQGDSGGPGMIDILGVTYAVGVVARSSYFPAADGDPDYCNYRGIYVNVQYFVDDWILPTMALLSQE